MAETMGLNRINFIYLLCLIFPIIVFEMAYFFEALAFRDNFLQIFLAAVPAYIFSSILSSIYFYFVFFDTNRDYDILMSLIFGSILSFITPSDRFINLTTKAEPKRIIFLLQGESFVEFIVLLGIFNFTYKNIFGQIETIVGGVFYVFYMVVAGLLFGICMAVIISTLISYVYNDFTTEILLTISFTYLVLYISDIIFDISGMITVMSIAMIVSSTRGNLPSKMNQQLLEFWFLFAQCAKFLICIFFGILVIPIIPLEMHLLIHIPICYILSYFVRTLAYLIICPVIYFIKSKRVKWFDIFLLIWSGERSVIHLGVSCVILLIPQTEEYGKEITSLMFGMMYMTLLINSGLLNLILNELNVHLLKNRRCQNMIFALSALEKKRLAFLHILQVDPEMTKAAWSIVNKRTIIKNPYKLSRKFTVVSNSLKAAEFLRNSLVEYNTRSSTASEAKTIIVFENTRLDLMWDPNKIREKEMDTLNDILISMLEYLEISFIRQKEEGKLTRVICSQLIRITTQRKIKIIEKPNYEHLIGTVTSFFTEQLGETLKNQRKYTSWCTSEHVPEISASYKKSLFRRLCYDIVINSKREIVFSFLFGIAGIVNILIIFELINVDSSDLIPLNAIFVIWIFLYWFMGMISLFLDIFEWRIIWFIIDIIIVISVIISFLYPSYQIKMGNLKALTICYLLYFFRILEELDIYILQGILLRLTFCSDNMTEMILSKGYLQCTAFIRAFEETQVWLRSYITHRSTSYEKKLINQIRRKLIEQKIIFIKELSNLNQARPWIGNTVRTRQAIQNIIFSLDGEIDDYRDNGLIDTREVVLLKRELEAIAKGTICHIHYIKPISKKECFYSITWLEKDEELIHLLETYSESLEIPPGVDIAVEGQLPDEIFLISTGIIKMIYEPSSSVIENLKEWGMVPNRGFVSSLEYDAPGMDALPSMNVIGLHGLLTGREYSVTLRTMTHSQVFRIPRDSLLISINSKEPEFQKIIIDRMWKHHAINLSQHLIFNEAHQSILTRSLKTNMDRGFIITLKPRQGVHLTSCVQEAVLLEGVLETWGDDLTGFKFIAPVVLSRTVTRLRAGRVPGWLGATWAARVFIIPISHISLDIVRLSLNIGVEETQYSFFPKIGSHI